MANDNDDRLYEKLSDDEQRRISRESGLRQTVESIRRRIAESDRPHPNPRGSAEDIRAGQMAAMEMAAAHIQEHHEKAERHMMLKLRRGEPVTIPVTVIERRDGRSRVIEVIDQPRELEVTVARVKQPTLRVIE